VGVEWNDELRRRHVLPDAEIHSVGADHPSEKEVQPFARASARRPREKVRDAGTWRAAAVCGPQVGLQRTRRERLERRRQIGRGSIVPFEKERLDRAFLQHALKDDDKRRQIVALRPPVNDGLQIARLPPGVEGAHVRRWRSSHHREKALDRLQHAGNASKRKRGCAEAGHFSVGGTLEATY